MSEKNVQIILKYIWAIWIHTYGRPKSGPLIAFAIIHSLICIIAFGWFGLLAVLVWMSVPAFIWLIDHRKSTDKEAVTVCPKCGSKVNSNIDGGNKNCFHCGECYFIECGQ